MRERMKAITIQQPYASLTILPQESLPNGATAKMCENRTWETRYRGPVVIHAGCSYDWFKFGDWPGYTRVTERTRPELPFGAVVGIADLAAIVTLSALRAGHETSGKFGWLLQHVHATGPKCWIWDNVRRFVEPIPYVGRQGLFTIPVDVVQDAIQTAEFVRSMPTSLGG